MGRPHRGSDTDAGKEVGLGPPGSYETLVDVAEGTMAVAAAHGP